RVVGVGVRQRSASITATSGPGGGSGRARRRGCGPAARIPGAASTAAARQDRATLSRAYPEMTFPMSRLPMKDRMLTIALSVLSTYGCLKVAPRELEVDRLIVRKELIVSDTGSPWEEGFEAHQIPRGIYAKPVGDGAGGLWVRSRLIKGEIDDPF